MIEREGAVLFVSETGLIEELITEAIMLVKSSGLNSQ